MDISVFFLQKIAKKITFLRQILTFIPGKFCIFPSLALKLFYFHHLYDRTNMGWTCTVKLKSITALLWIERVVDDLIIISLITIFLCICIYFFSLLPITGSCGVHTYNQSMLYLSIWQGISAINRYVICYNRALYCLCRVVLPWRWVGTKHVFVLKSNQSPQYETLFATTVQLEQNLLHG